MISLLIQVPTPEQARDDEEYPKPMAKGILPHCCEQEPKSQESAPPPLGEIRYSEHTEYEPDPTIPEPRELEYGEYVHKKGSSGGKELDLVEGFAETLGTAKPLIDRGKS